MKTRQIRIRPAPHGATLVVTQALIDHLKAAMEAFIHAQPPATVTSADLYVAAINFCGNTVLGCVELGVEHGLLSGREALENKVNAVAALRYILFAENDAI